MSTALEVPGDFRMARRLWPFLVASAVGLIPFTVFGMYLVPISDAAGGSVAEIGGLRGLGGLAAHGGGGGPRHQPRCRARCGGGPGRFLTRS